MGYLMEENADCILIAQSLSTAEERMGDVLSVPRKMIIKIRKLK